MQSPPPHGGQRNCLLYTGVRRAGFHCEKTSVTNAEFSRFCLMKPSSLVAHRRLMILCARPGDYETERCFRGCDVAKLKFRNSVWEAGYRFTDFDR